ncbi:AI-2E family transporter [Bacillus massilinigeriensis]|uniref:AI-2E family transporter n=1 Tax=Bacillus massilionigeriensis TaxID=1805475 RepID=UPI00096B159F|nr:AI-2E family transporter [Bacillus massilionigeriensis]
MAKKKFQYWTLQILIIVSIIYVSTKISFLFEPVGIFVSTLFFPILISGFLYFLLNPLVNLLQKMKLPRTIAILFIYVAVIGLIVLVIGNIAPVISKQVTALFNDLPTYAKKTEGFINSLSDSKQFKWFMEQEYVSPEDIEKRVMAFANTLPDTITSGLSNIVSVITNIAILIVTVPFLLFYMFKDGYKLPTAISKFMPQSYRAEGVKTLNETAETLSAYIQGQITVALFVGTLAFIGYLIIGLKYALVMALIVAVTNIIPYVGPFLGGAPAVILALFDSPTKAILVVVVIVIAQQVEGNLLSPLILGKRLDTHPATIIIILLVAGNLAGVLGMILAIPTYACTKTIVVNFIHFLRIRREATAKISS